jgi:8-oxo-dGTP pyrophosphatase MutT (NUDIX family)
MKSLKQRLRETILNGLPGLTAHERMTTQQRRIELQNTPYPLEPRKSGVLILLYQQNETLQTIMIRRPKYDGVHSGQIAFPGGKMEEGDKDLVETALRETHEEIGVPATRIEVLGQLTELYIPPSNFLVQPTVGWLTEKPELTADPMEVEEILILPVSAFLEESALQEKEVALKDFTIKVPCYFINDHVIWGASAMIMTEFLDVLKSSE